MQSGVDTPRRATHSQHEEVAACPGPHRRGGHRRPDQLDPPLAHGSGSCSGRAAPRGSRPPEGAHPQREDDGGLAPTRARRGFLPRGRTPRGILALQLDDSLAGPTPLHGREIAYVDAFGGGDDIVRYSAATPCQYTNLAQIQTEPMLNDEAKRFAPGRIRYGQGVRWAQSGRLGRDGQDPGRGRRFRVDRGGRPRPWCRRRSDCGS